MTDLLPVTDLCPFCGTGMHRHDNCFSHPRPAEGDCILQHYSFDKTKITAWNTRAHPSRLPDAGLEIAARWHDEQAALAKVRYEELNRYSDHGDEREGWRSWKDKEDRERFAAASIRALSSPRQTTGDEAVDFGLDQQLDLFRTCLDKGWPTCIVGTENMRRILAALSHTVADEGPTYSERLEYEQRILDAEMETERLKRELSTRPAVEAEVRADEREGKNDDA